jgi:hypothetical protein
MMRNKIFTEKMCSNVEKIVVGRLENLGDEEMKDLDKNTVSNILSELGDFLSMGLDKDKVNERLDSVKLSMALRFLKSSNMKKRLNGINQIKEYCLGSMYKHRSIMDTDNFRRPWGDDDSPRKSTCINPEVLLKWLRDNQVLEYILSESSHIEVIKRSTSIIKFLSSNNSFTYEHLDLLWKCQEDKHEATVLGIFETINDIALDLDKESLDYIYSKIEAIPLKKYNEHMLSFVKDFTINACKIAKNHQNIKNKENFKSGHATNLIEISSDDEEEKTNEIYVERAKDIIDGKIEEPEKEIPEYGIPILYSLSLQGNELGSLALKSLIEILKPKTSNTFKMSYVLKAIKNLQKGTSIYQSLVIITSILPKCFGSRSFEAKTQLHLAIMGLNSQFDFISLILKNIEIYNEIVQNKMVDLVNKGIVPENISKATFEGNTVHSDYLDKLLEFIEFVSIHTLAEIEVGKENIEKLWNIFVDRSSIEYDKNLFFKWLHKEKFYGHKKFSEKKKENSLESYDIPSSISGQMEAPQKFGKGSFVQTLNNRRIFTSEEREYLFTQILCNSHHVDKKEISYNCFKSFEKYFVYENRENSYINWKKHSSSTKGIYTVIKFESIIGMDTLWEIVTL